MAVTINSTITDKGIFMFGIFKTNPADKLRRQYNETLTRAMRAQREGDIRTYSELTAAAEKIRDQIEAVAPGSMAK